MASALRSGARLVRSTMRSHSRTGSLGAPTFRGIITKAAQIANGEEPKPSPWPYEAKRYQWYHSVFNLDSTVARLDENSKIIVVEGNIGVGKTTLAQNLADQLGMKYYPEASFDNLYHYLWGYDLRDFNERFPPDCRHFEVKEFYEDPHHKQVARFQVCKYYARHVQYSNALLHLLSTGQGVILERSAFSDFVFVDAMVKMGFLSRPARRYYYDLKSNTIQELLRPHCVIYLDAPVEVCMERVKSRNTPYEVNSPAMTLDYLKLIEKGYKQHFLKQMAPFCETIVYDWTKLADAEVVAEDLEKIPFDKERVYFDPMLRDWRDLTMPWDWDVQRRRYTDWDKWSPEFFELTESHGADEIWTTAEDTLVWKTVHDEILLEIDGLHIDQDKPNPIWNNIKLMWR